MGIFEIFDPNLTKFQHLLNPYKCISGKSVVGFKHNTWRANSCLLPLHQLVGGYIKFRYLKMNIWFYSKYDIFS